jgi:hypothetical protein
MENTPQPKKTNWAMIILLVILVPVLLLGYKFISKKMDGTDITAQNIHQTPNNGNNNASSQNTDFLSGTWYRNDPTINSKYIFDAPQTVNGTLQGQVDMVMDDRSAGKVNYEVIGNGKLRISDPQGSFNPWEMGYAYNAAVQSLEIIASGNSATYTRNPVYVPPMNNTPAPNTTPVNNSAPGNMTTQQNKNINTSQLPPVGFDSKPADFQVPGGAWSNAQGPGSDRFVMSLTNVQQNGSKIKGEIECQFFDKGGNHTGDGLWYFNGAISGSTADISVTDLKGNLETKGTLFLSGATLKFSMNKQAGLLPKNATLREH